MLAGCGGSHAGGVLKRRWSGEAGTCHHGVIQYS